mmetsp:Transcript_16824/g.35585  ORF Transcript_16824/g.35585 Transcript_16824/m.35585 type:complete len:217 (-) Transcript_16824:274-924(-)
MFTKKFFFDAMRISLNPLTRAAAAIKIGDDVFELQGGAFSEGKYLINGVENGTLPTTFGGDFAFVEGERKSDYKFKKYYEIWFDKNHHVRLIIGNFLGVHLREATSEDFAASSGLMGDFESGLKLGRDGEKIEDHNAFAMDWQVGPDDPVVLSPKSGSVHYPDQCKMPSTTSRSLRKGGITEEKARSICEGAEELDHCVYDVMATNMAEVAEDYFD